MSYQRKGQDWVVRAKTLVAFYQNHRGKEFDQPAITRKRNLLSSLLSGGIAPGEFAERVKENGFSTRILSTKEAVQARMEYWGRDAKISLENEEYTYQELLDRFEEFETQIADFFKGRFKQPEDLVFPNDPDAIINKISDPELPENERLIFWEKHWERWGEVN